MLKYSIYYLKMLSYYPNRLPIKMFTFSLANKQKIGIFAT